MRAVLSMLLLVGGSLACTCLPSNVTLSTTLPNVLIVGDSISSNGTGYYLSVIEQLSGLAHVQACGGVEDNGNNFNKGTCGTSFGVVECAASWLAGGGWDVIHFNWGLHDICPKKYAPVTLDQYVSNVKATLAILRTGLNTNGNIVWASTTPVPPSYSSRNNSDVIALNAAILPVLQDAGVVLGADLYAAATQRCNRVAESTDYPNTQDCDYLQRPSDVHFNDLGKQFTGILVSAAIAPLL